MPSHFILGVIAGIVSFSFYFFYIVSILRGESKPEKETWWVLSIVGICIALSYFYSGARSTMWIPLGESVGPLIIALLSIKYGEVESVKVEKFSLLGVLCGSLLWVLFKSPTVALVSFVSIDFLGILPTIHKSYYEPHTENFISWFLAFIACIINLFAIETLSFSLFIYPVYALLVNLTIVIFISKRKVLL